MTVIWPVRAGVSVGGVTPDVAVGPLAGAPVVVLVGSAVVALLSVTASADTEDVAACDVATDVVAVTTAVLTAVEAMTEAAALVVSATTLVVLAVDTETASEVTAETVRRTSDHALH